jgi:hypothetical protein
MRSGGRRCRCEMRGVSMSYADMFGLGRLINEVDGCHLDDMTCRKSQVRHLDIIH